MTNLKGIPKKFHESILDFYHDEDGWWLVLKYQGKYILEGYHAEYTIHEDTKAECLRVFKECVTKKITKEWQEWEN